jgi:hypothetical protein
MFCFTVRSRHPRIGLSAAHPRRSAWRRHALFALLSLLALNLLLPAIGASAAPVILDPHTSAFGKTYAEWSAAWWQYTLSFPTATSPFLDATGANCAVGQNQQSPVFFLVGNAFSSDPVQRDQCVVPAGKALFFPIINVVDVNTTSQTAAELRLEIKPLEDGAHNLHASIDGVNVPDPAAFRTPSTVFSLALPVGNVFGLTPGTYSPAVADGYYLLVAPLPPGPHTITFGGIDGSGFMQSITYHLVVTIAGR